MGDVLELRSIQCPLERAWLQAAGFSASLQWQIVGGTLGKAYRYRSIVAQPALVAAHRRSGLRVITMVAGGRDGRDEAVKVHSVLNAIIVGGVLVGSVPVSANIVFDDGTRFELRSTSGLRTALLRESLEITLRQRGSELSTEYLSEMLAPRYATGIVAQRIDE